MKTSKFMFLLAALLVTLCARTQNTEEQDFNDEIVIAQNVPDSLPKKIIFGFSLGKSESRYYEDRSAQNVAAYGRGFYLGVMSERIFNDHFSVILQSNLLITDAKKMVQDYDHVVYETSLSPVTLAVAPLAMVRLPLEKFRPYLSVGPTWRLPIKSEVPGQRIYGLKQDWALSAAAGLEKKIGTVTFCPEVRYLYGLSDIDKSPFIGALYRHSMHFGITIKG